MVIFVINPVSGLTRKKNKLNKNPIRKKQKKPKTLMRDNKPINERRKHPRLKKILPIKLKQTPEKEFDISTQTTNISASGAYCTINKSVDLMTKLRLTLLLPLTKSRSKKIKKIECQGVIVRKEKNKENKKFPYRIGIFFNDLNNQDRKFLQSYVNSFLIQSK
jgi:hypothetical protein